MDKTQINKMLYLINNDQFELQSLKQQLYFHDVISLCVQSDQIF